MRTHTIIRLSLFATLLSASMTLASCRDGSNSQGREAGNDANGDTRGSDAPADNENSGLTTDGGSDSGDASK